jgi:ketosteroid isomerase-like protein
MSQENVELAKRLNAMALAGDIDGALALAADDLVVTEIHGPLDEPSVSHGREAALSRWARSSRYSTIWTGRSMSGSMSATG